MHPKPEIYTKSLKALKSEISKPGSLVTVGGKTSTVIPYHLEPLFGENVRVINLSQMPKELKILENGDLMIRGPVDWREARVFCGENGREILTAPTEDTAHILSGLATSATGERCFGFGTLREQVRSVKYINAEGEEKALDATKEFTLNAESESIISSYRDNYRQYENFKNAPFPRFEKETDLMIGTEGQLGVITEAVIATKKKVPTSFFFILVSRWEKDFVAHDEIFKAVQQFREDIYCCELIDSNSLSVLPPDENPGNGEQDLIFVEFETEHAEKIFENFIANLKSINIDNVYEIGATKCHQLRMKVPRLTFERNSQMGVVKKGTDVQTSPDKFVNLIEIYRKMASLGVDYNLFGHFGDAHLHFNFLPTANDVKKCDEALSELYQQVFNLGGSPFAEHGIGLIKQKFIKNFYGSNQLKLFYNLKSIHDPENKFFPTGFMSIDKGNH